MILDRLGCVFSVAAAVCCSALYGGTFLALIPPVWVFVPFALMFCAAVCFPYVDRRRVFRLQVPGRDFWGSLLFIFAVANFLYLYRHFDGATGVTLRNGTSYTMYKDTVLRPISREDYLLFPKILIRAMAAGIGMTAFLGMSKSRA